MKRGKRGRPLAAYMFFNIPLKRGRDDDLIAWAKTAPQGGRAAFGRKALRAALSRR